MQGGAREGRQALGAREGEQDSVVGLLLGSQEWVWGAEDGAGAAVGWRCPGWGAGRDRLSPPDVLLMIDDFECLWRNNSQAMAASALHRPCELSLMCPAVQAAGDLCEV